MARSYPMPSPFLKWAGGKRSLFDQIAARLPAQIDNYVEPFVGGGAVFFGLHRQGRLTGAVLLADRNPELVHLWRQVRDNVDAVIEWVRGWEPTEEIFYQIRSARFDPPAQAAARTLWLNRYCYNGLYRLNSKGGFNVPFGRYANARVNFDNLKRCAEALQGVAVEPQSFEVSMAEPAGKTFYLDPPYHPVSKTSRFNRYDGQVFGEDHQDLLSKTFYGLRAGGAIAAVLSNSDTPLTRGLYPNAETVQVRRAINSKASARGAINELLVTLPPGD